MKSWHEVFETAINAWVEDNEFDVEGYLSEMAKAENEEA